MLSGAIAYSGKDIDYHMDLLGNLVASAGGFKQNSASTTFSHAVNATNEITTIARSNPVGEAKTVTDDFATMSASTSLQPSTYLWTMDANGSWTSSGGKATVSSIAGSPGYSILDAATVVRAPAR